MRTTNHKLRPKGAGRDAPAAASSGRVAGWPVLRRGTLPRTDMTGVVAAALGAAAGKAHDADAEAPGRVQVETVTDEWLHRALTEAGRRHVYLRIVKRGLDVVLGCTAIVMLVPLGLLIGLIVALDGGFPVLYMQDRVGEGEQRFRMIKFRTMIRDAESAGPQWASHIDPRVTRVGRMLRRTRLDEIPQLVNVVRGDMSLVGPRPERPGAVRRLTADAPAYAIRHLVRPGLTGWAQVNFGYANSIETSRTKLEYDLYYVKRRSFLFDALILARTVWTVLASSGT